jgi:3-deoxy-D-manno-octulosonic-acid transferase
MTQTVQASKSVLFLYHTTRLVYTLLLCILLPFILLVFRKKLDHSAKQLNSRSIWERFGKVSNITKNGGIHIHCVSVGEINAANGLINAFLKEYPNLPIMLTTSSTTGAVHAYNLFKDRVQHSYLPVDVPFFMRRFYDKVKPILVLVTEVEVWPNMLHTCAKRRLPVVLINARMTTKSLTSYRRVLWLFRHAFRQFSVICAQSSESFENFLAYGVYKSNVKLSRNMKFDLLPDCADEELGQQILMHYQLRDRPILLAASTHYPEEKILLDIYEKLKQTHNNLLLIIVPRHPYRFDEVHQFMQATGFKVARVSQGSIASSLLDEESETQVDNKKFKLSDTPIDCLLVDTMGWLKACYSICTLAFVGGSFANKGGHNALEAALYSKPIAMGPSTFNNPIICQHLASQNALMITESKDELEDVLAYWLSRPEDAMKDGERGFRVLLQNAGSVEYTMSILRPILAKVSR